MVQNGPKLTKTDKNKLKYTVTDRIKDRKGQKWTEMT